MVSTVAGTTYGYLDGPANLAQFAIPSGICLDNNGNLYIANRGTHNIRKIDTDGNVSTYAGGSTSGNIDGIGIDSRFTEPIGICISSNGLDMYITQINHGIIRKITPILSSEDFNKIKVVVFPNPNKNQFTIQANEKIVEIFVFDLMGHTIIAKSNNENEIIVNHNLTTGIYFIKIKTEYNFYNTKITVE